MIPKIILPKARDRLNQQYEAMNQKFPCSQPQMLNCNDWVCSKDSNIKKLLEMYDAEIVLAESSVACLLDNHAPQLERQWEMPVKVAVVTEKGTVSLNLNGHRFEGTPAFHELFLVCVLSGIYCNLSIQ